GGGIGIPGLYVVADPGAKDPAAQQGSLSLRLGLGWAKSISFATGQTPVLRYNRQLYQAIVHDRIHIARDVNAKVISLDDAPAAYKQFDAGVASKFIIGQRAATQRTQRHEPMLSAVCSHAPLVSRCVCAADPHNQIPK